MKELSAFVDESGTQEARTTFYVVTLVLHDQSDDIFDAIRRYERSLADRGLPNIPFHATPLMRGHDDYAGLELAERKRLLSSFSVLVQNLPIRYRSFIYKSSEFGNPNKLQALIRRDLVSFLVDQLEYFQSYDHVKIYYDSGQPAVTHALKEAFAYALSKEAFVTRNSNFHDYRLSQVADYLCAIELTSSKYLLHLSTATDDKFFGSIGTFKRNWLKQARRKLLA